jgi:hypothetical protein
MPLPPNPDAILIDVRMAFRAGAAAGRDFSDRVRDAGLIGRDQPVEQNRAMLASKADLSDPFPKKASARTAFLFMSQLHLCC